MLVTISPTLNPSAFAPEMLNVRVVTPEEGGVPAPALKATVQELKFVLLSTVLVV
jgi:hypothetical protein